MRLIIFIFDFFVLGYGALREAPVNQTVHIGRDVTFRCVAESSTNEFEIYSQWRSNTGALLGFHDSGQLAGHQGRYSYIKDSPEELHLQIERVTLDDDGQFECQMLRPEEGPSRASAYLNVIVPPQDTEIVNYQAGSQIEVNEDTPLNITCVSPNGKPAASISWYVNGAVIDEGIQYWKKYNLNKTISNFAALHWTPRRVDHKKVLTCHAAHPESETNIRRNVTLNVLYPPESPKVSVFGGESYVRTGDNVTLICLVRGGNPPPTVTWFHRERPVSSHFSFDTTTQETRNSYSFIAGPGDHLSDYECRAVNRLGSKPAAQSIHVRVAYPPPGVELSGDVSIRLGESTTLQCRTKPSNPPAKITWLVNGHPMPSVVQNDRQEKHGTVSISNLTVLSADLFSSNHRIVVECTARNDEGTISKQHVIKILAPPNPPKIIGLDDVVYHDGDRVNASCEAIGGYPLSDLAWFKGQEKIVKGRRKLKSSKIPGSRSFVSGESTTSVVSFIVDRSMNGQRVRCEASNAAVDEPLTDIRTLSVVFLPRRLSIGLPESSRHQHVVNKEAKLMCTSLSSNPPPSITWQFYHNGEASPLIYNGETVLNETERDGSYTLENVVTFTPTEAHDGTIVHCIASHPLWPTTKNASYPLNVYYPPRLLVDSPIGIVVSEGESFRENLTVKANPPVSAWRWRKNGAPFDHTIGNVFARGATLSGRTLRSTDAGSYTLFAINSVGTANVSINLSVEYGARIISISSPIIASVGETVVLECEVDGEPRKPGMVQWLKDGEKVNAQLHGQTRAVLRLNASESSSGQYICRGDNGVGEAAESPAYLLVNSAPKLKRLPSLSRAAGQLGGRARARCRASAVPDVEFVWDRSGDLIKGNSSKYSVHSVQLDYSTFESTLYIMHLSPDDYQATIKCTARNKFGTDSMRIPVGPLSPPDVPLNLVVENSTTSAIVIAWTAGFDGGVDQMFEVRYHKEGEDVLHGVNTSHTSMRLSGLHPGKVYAFQLRAINERGFSSQLTEPIYAGTLSEDGDAAVAIKRRYTAQSSWLIIMLIALGVIVVLCCLTMQCYCRKRQQKKKLQEKTEQVRTALNSDGVRPVQMYGTMLQAVRSHHEEVPELSEDDHSVRTMIEVNPNGYLQQIDVYDERCGAAYEFDPRQFTPSRSSARRQGPMTYANMPYPEPPFDAYSSLSRRSINNNNNNDHFNQLSTFIQPNGVRAGPIHYSQLDGDLV